MRVDTFRAFILDWLAEMEAPTCAVDGSCVEGCASHLILDCACATDGACIAGCPAPRLDPDCPAACDNDGVCSTEACPTPDIDCTPEGEACSSDAPVPGPTLRGQSAAHGASTAAPPVPATTPAPKGMTCQAEACRLAQRPSAAPGEACTAETFCLEGSTCLDFVTGSHCERPCTSSSACAAGLECQPTLTAGVSSCQSLHASSPSPTSRDREPSRRAAAPRAPVRFLRPGSSRSPVSGCAGGNGTDVRAQSPGRRGPEASSTVTDQEGLAEAAGPSGSIECLPRLRAVRTSRACRANSRAPAQATPAGHAQALRGSLSGGLARARTPEATAKRLLRGHLLRRTPARSPAQAAAMSCASERCGRWRSLFSRRSSQKWLMP